MIDSILVFVEDLVAVVVEIEVRSYSEFVGMIDTGTTAMYWTYIPLNDQDIKMCRA